MVKVVVACISMPRHVLACMPLRGVWGFLDSPILLLTQSGTNFDNSIYIGSATILYYVCPLL